MTINRYLSRRTMLSTGAAALGVAALPRLAVADYTEQPDIAGGVLKGKVMLSGAPPKPEEILISKDHGHCGEGAIVPDPVRVTADGYLADAVVALKDISQGKPWSDPGTVPKIVQARCKFEPYVQVARKGAELTILNEDPLLHNIHAYELIGRARRTMFNIAQPQAGQVDKHVLKMRRGDVIEIDCDAHNWMSAWIYTADHPYVGVADSKGEVSIDRIPPGSYELTAWHPVFGETAGDVAVKAGETSEFSVQFKV